jgi:redox-sensitive bicupin YhaK (pirin superfamily)
MSTHLVMQRVNHGLHFRAHALRGEGARIAPFISVDHAWMSAPTFPPHRHAGIAAVSYVFSDSETAIENRDSLGNHNLIEPGGLHWLTAGSGVVHEEVPATPGRTVHSLQIFVALSPVARTGEPSAIGLAAHEIPVVQRPGAIIRVPLGTFEGMSSPLVPTTRVTMLDIALEPEAGFDLPLPANEMAFLLPVTGRVAVDGDMLDPERSGAPLYSAQNSQRITRLVAGAAPARIMLFAGTPASIS